MNYTYKFFFTKDNEAIIQHIPSQKLLPFIYTDLDEFMLFTVLNNNKLITDDKFYVIKKSWMNQVELDKDKAFALQGEYNSKYDCDEIPLNQILEVIADEHKKREKAEEWLFTQVLNHNATFNPLTSKKVFEIVLNNNNKNNN